LPSFTKFTNHNGSSVKLYITNHPGDKTDMDLNKTISILEKFTKLVYYCNRIQPGIIAGITLATHLDTYEEDRQAIESVVGPIESADIDIGCRVTETVFQRNHMFFRKAKYMVIALKVNLAMKPSCLADEIVRRCDGYEENAKSRNLRARISCTAAYPSDGISKSSNGNGTFGSLENFYTFWCRVIENLADGKKHAKIIMESAFDESLSAFPDSINYFNPYSTEYFQGWWRRTSDILMDESAFVEKIECKSKCSIF